MLDGISPNYIYQSTYDASKDREIKKELDKDAFMQLLVTELKYQDPTSPMDNKEFISQMSQLTSTEQIMNMSKAVQNMISSQSNLFRIQTTGMIGKNVVVANNVMKLSNGSTDYVNFAVDEESPVYVEVYDADNKLVVAQELGDLSAGVHSFLWNGKNQDGTAMEDGEYTFKIYRYNDNQKVELAGLDGGKVDAVQFLDNEYYVVINGQRYPISSIQEISDITDNESEDA
ncbi:MAG TPA: flagellar hook assembly protein FlgD [Tepiditoga sp.]|nr:flagellar hook assembly protein FlgD [Tepiditoga sp.]